MTTDEVWQAFLGRYDESKTFFHGHTYGGNPLGAAVALATLDVFDEERTLEKLPPKIARLGEHLARIADAAARRRRPPARPDRRPSSWSATAQTKEPFPWEERRGIRVCDHARQKGVWLRPLGNVIVIMPPLSISLDELDRICEAVEYAIRQCFA